MSERQWDGQRGASFIEAVIIMGIIAMLAAMSTTAMTSMLRKRSLRAASAHVRSLMQLTDAVGQTKGVYRGIRFTRIGDNWYYTVYEDGNSNGVLSADITAGIDRMVEGPHRLLPFDSLVTVGFPPGGVPDPDTGVVLKPGARAVQFGRSNLCSFSENGTCTPGSVYLTDNVSSAAAIRCSGASGRIYILYHGFDAASWSE